MSELGGLPKYQKKPACTFWLDEHRWLWIILNWSTAVMCARNMRRDGTHFGWHQPHPNQLALNTSLVDIQRHFVKLQSLLSHWESQWVCSRTVNKVIINMINQPIKICYKQQPTHNPAGVGQLPYLDSAVHGTSGKKSAISWEDAAGYKPETNNQETLFHWHWNSPCHSSTSKGT